MVKIVLAVLVVGCVAAAQEKPAMVDFVPPATDEVLFNPRMGLYLQYPPLDSKPDEWFMKLADIAYYRLDWATLNPEKGVTKFDEWFGPMFDFWVKQNHKRFAFRVMCQCMHSRGKYVTPQWVFDQGVPGVTHIGLAGQEQMDPVFWDDRYLDVQCEFIQKLGEYVDGRPGLEFVDIGSIGEWGEMHLARWTSQQLAETGYTEAKYIMAYRRTIDAFAKAFPHTQVFLNVGGQDHLTINDYATIHGMHFRQDGLTPSGASYDVGEWLYQPYSRRGVVCNFEFCYGLDEMSRNGMGLKETLDKGLSAPISYLNTNLGDYRKLPEEARTLLTDAARRIGYRFVLTKLQCLAEFHLDGTHAGRIPITAVWRNDGVAPCYDSFALEWSLVDAAGKTIGPQLEFPVTPTTRWWPGEEQAVKTLLRVPADTPPGEYRLQVAMVLPETGQRIMLGIAGRDDQGRYRLCSVRGIAGSGPAGKVIYEEGFEGQAAPWSAVAGMSATVDTGAAHSGQASLLVSGTQEQGWNYVSHRVTTPLVGASKYRLTGWLLVEQIAPGGHPPYLKIGVNGANGKWITNFNTGPYDVAKPGTWQELTVEAEVPPEAATADLCIEKGAFATPITAKMRLDDVKLELLEAP
jgi:hypothetical protein